MAEEMVERVEAAVRNELARGGGTFNVARAAIEAMREPTQAQYDALCATGKMWRELDSRTVWQTYIDAALTQER